MIRAGDAAGVGGLVRRSVAQAAFPALACGIVAGGALLPLMFQPLWRDEGTTYLHAAQPTLAEVLQSVHRGELAPPLYFVLEHFWVQLAGTSAFALRFPSLVAVAMAIGFLYATARRVRDPRAGYATAACALLAPMSPLVGTEARPYALTLFLASLALWFVARMLFDEPRHVVRLATGLGITVALLCWTHYTAWPVLVGLLLAAPAIGTGTGRPGKGPYLVAILLAGVTTVGLFRDVTSAARASVNISPDSATSNLFQRLDARMVWFNPLIVAEPIFIAACVVAAGIWLVYIARRRPAGRLRAEDQLLLVCFAIVGCGVGANVARSAPAFHHLAAYAPAAWLIMGNFYSRAAAWLGRGHHLRTLPLHRKAGLVGLAAVAILAFSAFPITWTNERISRSGSQALVHELERRAGRDVMLIASPDALSPSLKYYLKSDPGARLQGLPTWSNPWYYGYVRYVDAGRKRELLRSIDEAVKHCTPVAFAVDWNWKGFSGISYAVVRDIVSEESARHGVAFHRTFPGTIETMDLVLLAPACKSLGVSGT